MFEQYQTDMEGHLKLADMRLSSFLQTMQAEVDNLAANKLLYQEKTDDASIHALFSQFVRLSDMIGNVHFVAVNTPADSTMTSSGIGIPTIPRI
ncbi:hypothetical protein [Brevibacillus choshinensis]|uniref:LXG domain-containing protein n=1 Tax=Brevibacillus choshinensis TaxID=54911 RepID=A0ABX7FR16_BRECH|nr:hypothetical protein JNE38_00520 [Brevibacillus choshinensis]